MGVTEEDIIKVLRGIVRLAEQRIGVFPKNTAILCGENSDGLHRMGIHPYDRLACLFPVENIGTEDYEVSVILFAQNCGFRKSKQFVYLPARVNGMVQASLSSSVRKTNEQVADQIASFILTGQMEF